MSASDDGGYVHDPSAFDEDGDPREETSVRREAGDGTDWVDDPAHPASADREFDWRGWILVCVVVFSFVVAPLAIRFWPPNVSYRVALLILPLFPAVALGLTAVWATTRP